MKTTAREQTFPFGLQIYLLIFATWQIADRQLSNRFFEINLNSDYLSPQLKLLLSYFIVQSQLSIASGLRWCSLSIRSVQLIARQSQKGRMRWREVVRYLAEKTDSYGSASLHLAFSNEISVSPTDGRIIDILPFRIKAPPPAVKYGQHIVVGR